MLYIFLSLDKRYTLYLIILVRGLYFYYRKKNSTCNNIMCLWGGGDLMKFMYYIKFTFLKRFIQWLNFIDKHISVLIFASQYVHKKMNKILTSCKRKKLDKKTQKCLHYFYLLLMGLDTDEYPPLGE